MSIQDRKLRVTRWLIAGITLACVVSFSTAAMVVLLPGTSRPAAVVQGAVDPTVLDMREYMQLHQARHTVVPGYMPIDIAVKGQ